MYTKHITLAENIKTNNKLDEAESRISELYNISKKNILYISKLIELDLKENIDLSITKKKIKRFYRLRF